MKTAVALLLAFSALPIAAQSLSPLAAPEEKPKVEPPSNALDKNDLEFYVRHLYVYGPQIHVAVSDPQPSSVAGLKKVEVTASYQLASKKHEFLVSDDGMHIIEGKTYAVDLNPFHETNQAIDTFSAPGFGKEGATVAMVVYSDFQCPYCAKEAKLLRGQLNAVYGSKVRVYFRDFPLEMHDWAKDAAVAGRCVFLNEPNAFWTYHDWVFNNQESITKANFEAKFKEALATTDADAAKVEACYAARETESDVDKSIAEGQSIGVSSTPTVFINGRKLPGSIEWNNLKTIIDYELDYQEVTHNAGDDCGCAVELPSFP